MTHNNISIEQQVADHLENKFISLNTALEELNLAVSLSENTAFCMALDMLILECADCGYWYAPSMLHLKEDGDEVCDDCLPFED